MSRSRSALLLLPLAALALAACGSDDSSTAATVAPTAAPVATDAPAPATEAPAATDAPAAATEAPSGATEAASAADADVQLAETPLGSILVDGEGRTLYLFTNDAAGATTSACTGDCAANWPALVLDGEPTVGAGLEAEDFGTVTAGDGASTQVTYYGHPLYTFAGDAAAGDTNGQGIGGVWFAVTAAGTAVTG